MLRREARDLVSIDLKSHHDAVDRARIDKFASADVIPARVGVGGVNVELDLVGRDVAVDAVRRSLFVIEGADPALDQMYALRVGVPLPHARNVIDVEQALVTVEN